MSTTDYVADLLTGLLDDAAMFPPGNASPEQALRAHLGYRSSAVAPFVGPLLVPADRWPQLRTAHRDAGEPPLDVVQIGEVAVPDDLPASIRVRAVEVPVPSPPLPDPGAGRSLAAEVRNDAALSALLAEVGASARAGGDVVAKFRTGGTSAEAFPDAATLAGFVTAAVAAGAPFKLTAGLHRAVRSTSEEGFEQHGFLNVCWAVDLALSGEATDAVEEALLERDADAVAGAVRALPPARRAAVRRAFVSFGCCGVLDPLDDLVALGLLRIPGRAAS